MRVLIFRCPLLESFELKGKLGATETLEYIWVEKPAVSVTVTGPDIVGQERFELLTFIKNTGKVDANLKLDFAGEVSTFTLKPTEHRLFSRDFNINKDTAFNIILSSDVNKSVIKQIKFDGKLLFSCPVLKVYPIGAVSIPINLLNHGNIDLSLNFVYELVKDGMRVNYSQRSYYLSPGAQKSDTLIYNNLSEGEYVFNYYELKSGLAKGSVLLKVARENIAEIKEIRAESVEIRNTGSNDFYGTLKIKTDFAEIVQDVAVPVGDGKDFNYTLPAVVVASSYTVKAELFYGENVVSEKSIDIKFAPAVEITGVPSVFFSTSGLTSAFEFDVKNIGNAAGNIDISVSAGDVVNVTKKEFFSIDEQKHLSFEITPADDLDSRQLMGFVRCKNEFDEIKESTFTLKITGYKAGVTAQLDKSFYVEGDTATFTLNLWSANNETITDAFVKVNFNNFESSATLTNLTKSTQTVSFNVPIHHTGQKLFYGVYLAGGRALYLNSAYIYPKTDVISIVPDRQVYGTGDHVNLNVQTDIIGAIDITAPGYAGKKIIENSGIMTFTLPQELVTGTYNINYSFTPLPALSGCKAYWNFDESSGTIAYDMFDISNGTVAGAAWTSSGKSGQAISFDGVDDYAKFGSPQNLQLQTWSISFWVKPTRHTSGFEHLIGYGTKGWEIGIEGYKNGNLWIGSHGVEGVMTNEKLPVGVWSHIAVTCEDIGGLKKFKAYINNIPATFEGGKDSFAKPFIFSDPNFNVVHIGGELRWWSPYGYMQFFPGSIDEVTIYNRVLSAEEIAGIMAPALPSTPVISGTLPIDVVGYTTRILEASLNKPEYAVGEPSELKLRIEANKDISGLILKCSVRDVIGSNSEIVNKNVSLLKGENIIYSTGIILGTTEGIAQLVYSIYKNEMLFVSGMKTFDLKIKDALPPETNLTVDGSQFAVGGKIYLSGENAVLLSATDYGEFPLGVEKTELRIQNSELTLYSAPFTLPEGIHLVEYFSTDKAGNAEPLKSATFYVDATTPEVSLNITNAAQRVKGLYISSVPVTVEITATDPIKSGVSSGLLFLSASVNGDDWFEVTGPVVFSEGDNTVEVLAVDNVMNATGLEKFTISIDTVPPESRMNITGITYSSDGELYVSTATNLTITAQERGASGFKKIEYAVSNSVVSDTTTLQFTEYSPGTDFTILPNGKHYVYYRAVDNLDNTENIKCVHFILDKTPPESQLSVVGSQFSDNNKLYVTSQTVFGINSIDNFSGINVTRWRLDSDLWLKYTVPFKMQQDTGTLPAGCVAYWDFNEGTGNIAKDLYRINNGTIYEAGWIEGIKGSALNFDGNNDYVYCMANSNLSLSTFTLSCWIYAEPDTKFSGILYKRAANYQENYGLSITDGKISSSFYRTIGSWFGVSSNRQIEFNKWHNVVATYDGEIFKLYIDGMLDNSNVGRYTPMQNSNPFVIGTDYYRPTERAFRGKIDEVAIYNRALSIEEIAITYGIFKPVEEGEHLISYFSVDNVENVETVKTLNVVLDNTSPEIIISTTIAGKRYIATIDKINIDFSLTDLSPYSATGYLTLVESPDETKIGSKVIVKPGDKIEPLDLPYFGFYTLTVGCEGLSRALLVIYDSKI